LSSLRLSPARENENVDELERASHAGMKGIPTMKPTIYFTLLCSLVAGICANAQTPAPATYRVCMDVGHQQRFWRDPADIAGMDVKLIERVKYMTGELSKTATAADASLSYLKKKNHT
jgi:hypothetical protein